MNKLHLSAIGFVAAIGCSYVPTQSTAQTVTAAQTSPQQRVYPIPRTLFAEVFAKYGIGSAHRAMYANITGDQMWCIAQSSFGRPSAEVAISEARQLCENHAAANRLDPNKCVPVAFDDRQVYDPGPLFSVAERIQAQKEFARLIEQPHQE